MAETLRRLQLPDTTYFARQQAGEAAVSIFFAAIFSPRRMFEGMPRASGFRGSAHLLALYLAIPSLMASMLTGIVSVIVILPLSLAIGLGTTWLWAWYLAWAARRFAGTNTSVQDAFQVCAYSAPPLAFAWGPYLGMLTAFWNLFLNWRGLVSHAGLGGLSAAAILGAGIILLAVIIALIGAALQLAVPDNMHLLLSLLQSYLASQ